MAWTGKGNFTLGMECLYKDYLTRLIHQRRKKMKTSITICDTSKSVLPSDHLKFLQTLRKEINKLIVIVDESEDENN